jgi:hypothetical protein
VKYPSKWQDELTDLGQRAVPQSFEEIYGAQR